LEVTLRRKDLGDVLGDASQGIFQAANGHSASLATELLVSPGQMVYMHIPATELRNFADSLFPSLAKNQIADCASGMGHRYRAGHDILLDVPSTLFNHGPTDALKHFGHIIATDFPTKAGIPIPGFSHSGLGHLLEQWGIPKAWMSLNISDAGFGFLAIADGHSTLMAAIQGQLNMDFGTALQTFGAGALELKLAMVATTNPLLMTAAGVQNILAGLVATWNTFSVYVDPLEVFGAAGVSALLGFGMAKCLVGEETTVATRDAIRSGTIGAMYSVSTAFGYGALAGFVVCRLANALASHHNIQSQNRLSVNPEAHKLLIETLRSGSTDIDKILAETKPHWRAPEGTDRNSITRKLPSSARPMRSAARSLNEKPLVAPDNARTINSKTLMLPSEPYGLAELYRSVLLPGKWQGC
jgi:hypothetical protein